MNEAVHTGAADEVEKTYNRVVIRAPIHKVWAELTREDTVLPFFFNSTCKTPDGLKVGAPVRMVSKNGKHAAVVGDVLEFDPPYRYAHTFKFTSLEDPPCIIRYELKEVDGGTEFTLISERVPAGSKSENYMRSGGVFITNNLKAFVETGKASAGGRFALFMMGLTAFMTPSSCKIENWPFDRKINVD
ncbi:MAG: SRPBCC domain-containing protein [Gammaproteobacteria bacterium]|nr:SRPBCC domain-containing protein [Gammaproteobacteria bacterium]